MQSHYEGMLLASFAADSLALGAHWIYDTAKLNSELGRVENYLAPSPGSYHSGKDKGAFTHYGDQMLLLLQSISSGQKFELKAFADTWQTTMHDYEGYVDNATKKTLASFASGNDEYNSGSPSTDLGGAARIAPLLFHFREDLDLLLSYVKEQTAMTHCSTPALLAAEFLCRVTWKVLRGETPREAIEDALDTGMGDITLDLRVRSSLEETTETTEEIIKRCGQACSVENGLPGVVHLVKTYQESLTDALIENVMAGGDSAARGLATGMILGAHLGMEAIPQKWLDEMIAYQTIKNLAQ